MRGDRQSPATETNDDDDDDVLMKIRFLRSNANVRSAHRHRTGGISELQLATSSSRRRGKQLMLQPNFARSDRRFTSKEVLRSGAVASHRSGNERAMNVAKRSATLKRGLQPGGDTAAISDMWLLWGFQSNFMFKPVL